MIGLSDAGRANPTSDREAQARRRRLVALTTVGLWSLVLVSATVAAILHLSFTSQFMLFSLLLLGALSHLHSALAARARSNDWRRMLSLIYSANYLSEAFVQELGEAMAQARDTRAQCVLVIRNSRL